MRHNPFRPRESEWLRNMVELSILFLMAVILLRGFVLEGYLISTGSMAPGLLGLHKQVRCPSCERTFAFGVSFDDSVEPAKDSGQRLSKDFCSCPNCGQANIGVAAVPVNHGDQLLVHKGVFEFRRPRRWETAVFRNPADPGEAYVKRIVGLPGETLQVRDGDLYIEDQIARKDLATVRDMRIDVFDLQYQATADDWQIPWHLADQWRLDHGNLSCTTNTDESSEAPQTIPQRINWLRLHNWRWSGGTHVVETPLLGEDAIQDWQTCVARLQDRPVTWITRLQFDRERQVLRFHGVMPYEMQKDLVSWSTSETFRNAVCRLGALSHISPVTDRYGYNFAAASAEFPVRDLMLHTKIQWTTAPDEIIVDMPVENQVFRLQIDLENATAVLATADSSEVLRSVSLADHQAAMIDTSSIEIEVSNFDHRLIAAVNGRQLFTPLDLPLLDTPVDFESEHDPVVRAKRTAEIVTQQSRLSLGIRGGDTSLKMLKLYRDVYYTPGRRRNGVDSPLKIEPDTYFVQGDNSPVSSDSRNWPMPFVPHKLLVGKPFVVHLPSQPGKLTIGGFELPIRIPDFPRIRYIH